jgi:hypothetical protein
MLHERGQPEVVQELIAKSIIAVAENGEREPLVLAGEGLKALGLDVDGQANRSSCPAYAGARSRSDRYEARSALKQLRRS